MEKTKKNEFLIERMLQTIIEKAGTLSSEEKVEVGKKLSEEIRQRPFKVAIVGQSGVGKTSTIENVFGARPSRENKISSVAEGTTSVVEKVFDIEDGFSITIADMPGLKNDITKDENIYIPLYKQILPDCDLIVYVIDAHAKEIGVDVKILRDTIIPICLEAHKEKNIIIALNKVDVIGESFPEYLTNKEYHWDVVKNKPTETLAKLIKARLMHINDTLVDEGIFEHINTQQSVFYSAVYAFNMQGFLRAILESERGWIFVGTVAENVMAKASSLRQKQ